MLKEGIIDPKKVTRIALENAASVAGMILTTECALVDIKEETPPIPMGGGAECWYDINEIILYVTALGAVFLWKK